MRLPAGSITILAGGFLIGTLIAPVIAAQGSAPTDGQVAVRQSDQSVYLLRNNRKHWVATVVITEEEINAIPEGEPIYGGLQPASAAGSASSPPASSKPSAGSGSSGQSQATPTATVPAITITRDDSPGEVPRGAETFARFTSNNKEAVCDVSIKYQGGATSTGTPQKVNSSGQCEVRFRVPRDVSEGEAVATATAKVGSQTASVDFKFNVKGRVASSSSSSNGNESDDCESENGNGNESEDCEEDSDNESNDNDEDCEDSDNSSGNGNESEDCDEDSDNEDSDNEDSDNEDSDNEDSDNDNDED